MSDDFGPQPTVHGPPPSPDPGAGGAGSGPEALAIGARWDDFKLLDQLGEGGMGRVFRAHQISLGREVALKVLIGGVESRHRQQFIAEAKALARIASPHVVTVHAIGEHKGLPYFIMEYVRGQTLEERLATGWRPSQQEAVALVLQLCRGMQAVAHSGLCHRDIKPANVILTPQGSLKLMDFGLVGRIGGGETTVSTAQGVVRGTACYLSPEQGSGQKGDHRSDIYALGVVSYQLLTGRLPFEGTSSLSLIYHHVHTEPRNPREIEPGVSPRVASVVMRCLRKSPAQRYQSIEEVIREFEAARRPRWRLTGPYTLATAAAAVAAIVLAVVLASHGTHPSSAAGPTGTRAGSASAAATATPGTDLAQLPPVAVAHAPGSASGSVPSTAANAPPLPPGQPATAPPRAPGLGDPARDAAGWYADLALGRLIDRFRWCPGGSCVIGSPASAADHRPDELLHRVTISHGFYLEESECTQALWLAVMPKNPSSVSGATLPVDNVSRGDCQAFCDALARRVPGLMARLPWEAEWEYACRAGSSSAYLSARECDSASAWVSADQPRAAGTSRPLGWGLRDMLGNVGEWCADTYAPYPPADATDPHPGGDGDGVARGGAWDSGVEACNSAHRFRRWAEYRSHGTGLRVLVEAPAR